MTLLVKNGKLVTKGGVLISSDSPSDCGCCNYYYGDNCPECCSKLVGGTYVNGVYRFTQSYEVDGEEYTLTVDVSGIESNRLICDKDTIDINATLSVPDPDTDSSCSTGHCHRPQISWDRLWYYKASSPPVNASLGGKLYEDGRIDWGEADLLSVSASLSYDQCHVNSNYGQLGDILVVFGRAAITITLDTCATAKECCPSTHDCDPCCYYIDGSSAATADPESGEIVIRQELPSRGWKVKVTIPLDMNDSEIGCVGPDGGFEIMMAVELTPPIGNTLIPEICFRYHEWFLAGGPPKTNPCPEDDIENSESCAEKGMLHHSGQFDRPGCCGAPAAVPELYVNLYEPGGDSPIEVISLPTVALSKCDPSDADGEDLLEDCCCKEYVPCCSVNCVSPEDNCDAYDGIEDPNDQVGTSGLPYDRWKITNFQLKIFGPFTPEGEPDPSDPDTEIIFEVTQSDISQGMEINSVDLRIGGCPEKIECPICALSVPLSIGINKHGNPIQTHTTAIVTMESHVDSSGNPVAYFSVSLPDANATWQIPLAEPGLCNGEQVIDYTFPVDIYSAIGTFTTEGIRDISEYNGYLCQGHILLDANGNKIKRTIL